MSIINKKKLNEYLALSNELVIEVLEENKNSYKILIKGDKSKMKFKDNLKIVLSFIFFIIHFCDF